MTKHSPLQKFSIIFILFFLFVSCGGDMVEDVIETFESGNKKVYVRYHPEANVLEKHFYNAPGEMIHLERDSLSYKDDFKQFMLGTWIMEKMTVDDEIMFEKDSIINLDSLPNVYTFSSKKLLVSGPQYSAEYNIMYLDSTGIELNGIWTYGTEGEDTYRTERIFDRDYFQIISYYSIVWSEFLEDTEKEEEVIFRRVEIPVIETHTDTITIQDTTLVKLEEPR